MSDEFGRWLRERLRQKDWSQSEFSQKVGASTGLVSMWLSGKRLPSPRSIDKIADVFGLPVDTVLTIAGHRPDVEPLDANDPRELLAQRVRRIHLREDDLAIMNRNLDIWEARNKREREEKL